MMSCTLMVEGIQCCDDGGKAIRRHGAFISFSMKFESARPNFVSFLINNSTTVWYLLVPVLVLLYVLYHYSWHVCGGTVRCITLLVPVPVPLVR